MNFENALGTYFGPKSWKTRVWGLPTLDYLEPQGFVAIAHGPYLGNILGVAQDNPSRFLNGDPHILRPHELPSGTISRKSEHIQACEYGHPEISGPCSEGYSITVFWPLDLDASYHVGLLSAPTIPMAI